jgi:hypothetical protein
LAHTHHDRLKLDLSFFENHPDRKYSLDHFNITADIASQRESDRLRQRDGQRLNRIRQQYFGRPKVVVNEKSLLFDPRYLAIKSPACLDGYWQSESYFRPIEPLIRQEFKVRTPPSASNRTLIDEIKSVNAVSLHVRRGDYEKDPVINEVHGTCPPEYYLEATRMIAKKLTGPVFYVFSDDIAWAKEHIRCDGDFRFVSANNAEYAHEDLRLMYSCQHNITANSTFSWWGAWLNPNPEKIVIAPQKWFNDPQLNEESKTIVPESWTRI